MSLPRQRVVRVLGELRAFAVLAGYLQREKAIADPELRLAEEAVENTAARELGRNESEAAFGTLLAVAEKRRLPGPIESLARFRRDEAVPVLVAALESDFCRNAAAEGIRLVRAAAMPHLIESVRSPEPSRVQKSPTSMRRRRAALRLIAEDDTEARVWPSLKFLLHETDEWLQATAAEIAFEVEPLDVLVRILLKHLTSDDWVLVDEIAQFLRHHLNEVKSVIDEELADAASGQAAAQIKRARLLRWILPAEDQLGRED